MSKNINEFGIDYAGVDDNPVPDFRKVREAGFSFVYIRAAHGATPDPTYRRDAAAARAAGLLVGAYGIIRWPVRDTPIPVDRQAAALSSGIARAWQPGDLPTAIDVEFGRAGRAASYAITARGALQWVEGYAAALRAALPDHPLAVYTSRYQWRDSLDDRASAPLAALMLWCKTPYTYKAGQPPHLTDERIGALGVLPQPWSSPVVPGPGTRLQQFQGDARPVPGVGQADLNAWIPLAQGDHGADVVWLQQRLGGGLAQDGDFGPLTKAELTRYQVSAGLPATGVVDVRTFARLLTP